MDPYFPCSFECHLFGFEVHSKGFAFHCGLEYCLRDLLVGFVFVCIAVAVAVIAVSVAAQLECTSQIDRLVVAA